MTLYLLLVPVIIGQLFFVAYLIRARRDDRVRFGFCELQRTSVALLASPEGKALSADDYAFVRWLMEVNGLTIQEFNRIKNSFNLSGTLKGLRFFDHQVVKPAHRLDSVENKHVHELYRSFIRHTVNAFSAYTPFLMSRILLKLILSAAGLLAILGVKKVLLWTRELLDRWTDLQHETGPYCPA